MLERPRGGERAVLVHVQFPRTDFEADRQEFVELARAAGADIHVVIGGSRTSVDAKLFIGRGKADEVAAALREGGAELAIFNHELSPSQERNLEQHLKCRVLGRTGLILDIFARRARSHEGKLQVELAQLQHMATRLVRGWTHLERQRGGGIGMTGPGESQLELDRRLIRSRISHLKKKLERVGRSRDQNRRSRLRRDMSTVSLVGYTNAGKSTLFNALTGAATYASSQLFATLDPTLRQLALPDNREAVLADTVGFVRDLPHDLVAAFRATLEESREARLLLHVIDAADPERTRRVEQVHDVLQEIDAVDVPRIEVYNKIDLRPGEKARVERDAQGVPVRVWASALTGEGLDGLRQAVADCIGPDLVERSLRLRLSDPGTARLRARLYEQGVIRRERTDRRGVLHLQVAVSAPRLQKLLREAGVPPPA